MRITHPCGSRICAHASNPHRTRPASGVVCACYFPGSLPRLVVVLANLYCVAAARLTIRILTATRAGRELLAHAVGIFAYYIGASKLGIHAGVLPATCPPATVPAFSASLVYFLDRTRRSLLVLPVATHIALLRSHLGQMEYYNGPFASPLQHPLPSSNILCVSSPSSPLPRPYLIMYATGTLLCDARNFSPELEPMSDQLTPWLPPNYLS
jgi:hypothetical protein